MHMSSESLLVILLVGLIAGWLAGQIVQDTASGLLGIHHWNHRCLHRQLAAAELGMFLGTGIVAAVINVTLGALILLIITLVRGSGGWRGSWAELGETLVVGAVAAWCPSGGHDANVASVTAPVHRKQFGLAQQAPPEQKTRPVVSESDAALARKRHCAGDRRAGTAASHAGAGIRAPAHQWVGDDLKPLSLQSRKARTSDAANHSAIAAGRVAAVGRVHRRLHLLDHQDQAEFKRYLEDLCEHLSRLFCEESGDCAIRSRALMPIF